MILTKIKASNLSIYFLEEAPKQGYSCPYASHKTGCYSLCPFFRLSEPTAREHQGTHLRLALECSPNGRIFLGDLLIHHPDPNPESKEELLNVS